VILPRTSAAALAGTEGSRQIRMLSSDESNSKKNEVFKGITIWPKSNL
jgi:hypothetical protein